jgi:hypothetical protein
MTLDAVNSIMFFCKIFYKGGETIFLEKGRTEV